MAWDQTLIVTQVTLQVGVTTWGLTTCVRYGETVTSKMKFNLTHARESFKINQELLNYQPTQWYIYLCTSHVCNRLCPHNIFYRPVSQFRMVFQFIRSSISFFVGRGRIVRTSNNYQIFTQQNIISNYNKIFLQMKMTEYLS